MSQPLSSQVDSHVFHYKASEIDKQVSKLFEETDSEPLFLALPMKVQSYVEDNSNELFIVVKPLCEYLSLIS